MIYIRIWDYFFDCQTPKNVTEIGANVAEANSQAEFGLYSIELCLFRVTANRNKRQKTNIKRD